ncbi:MAG: hypothetical protein ACK44M_14320, partial [Chloroflexus sp.]
MISVPHSLGCAPPAERDPLHALIGEAGPAVHLNLLPVTAARAASASPPIRRPDQRQRQVIEQEMESDANGERAEPWVTLRQSPQRRQDEERLVQPRAQRAIAGPVVMVTNEPIALAVVQQRAADAPI